MLMKHNTLHCRSSCFIKSAKKILRIKHNIAKKHTNLKQTLDLYRNTHLLISLAILFLFIGLIK